MLHDYLRIQYVFYVSAVSMLFSVVPICCFWIDSLASLFSITYLFRFEKPSKISQLLSNLDNPRPMIGSSLSSEFELRSNPLAFWNSPLPDLIFSVSEKRKDEIEICMLAFSVLHTHSHIQILTSLPSFTFDCCIKNSIIL
jgi:hypothetical protein